jgi:hypothetical protein
MQSKAMTGGKQKRAATMMNGKAMTAKDDAEIMQR